MGELGLLGMTVPEEYGGAGADHVSYALTIMEIAAADGAASTALQVHNSLACPPILKFGSAEQKERFLRPLARGEQLGCFCLTEPDAGSDAAAITTRAAAATSSCSTASSSSSPPGSADIAIVFAVTDPAAGKKGLSAFIVPTRTPGYSVARSSTPSVSARPTTARSCSRIARSHPTSCSAKKGEGLKIALANLEGGRIGVAAQSVGMARAAYDAALAYAKERRTFGKPIIEHQAVGFRLADMATGFTPPN